jgi:hypothetical protein
VAGVCRGGQAAVRPRDARVEPRHPPRAGSARVYAYAYAYVYVCLPLPYTVEP